MMNHEEKINYMRIAAGIAGFGINNQNLDLLVSIYDLVTEKKSQTTMKDAIQVEIDVKNRADAKSRSELLDRVSKKVA